MTKAVDTSELFVSCLSPLPGKGPRHPAKATTPGWEAGRETVRVKPVGRATGYGHNPDLGGGTPECQVCAFNSRMG